MFFLKTLYISKCNLAKTAHHSEIFYWNNAFTMEGCKVNLMISAVFEQWDTSTATLIEKVCCNLLSLLLKCGTRPYEWGTQ